MDQETVREISRQAGALLAVADRLAPPTAMAIRYAARAAREALERNDPECALAILTTVARYAR